MNMVICYTISTTLVNVMIYTYSKHNSGSSPDSLGGLNGLRS